MASDVLIRMGRRVVDYTQRDLRPETASTATQIRRLQQLVVELRARE